MVRDMLLDEIKRLLIGPNPIDEFKQENGEEILFADSPLKTYITGILFPQMINTANMEEEGASFEETETIRSDDEESEIIEAVKREQGTKRMAFKEDCAEIVSEAETSKINNYKQSAMGITLCVPEDTEELFIDISAGAYSEKNSLYPKERKDEDGKRYIVMSEMPKKCYFRKSINSNLTVNKADLPNADNRYICDKYVFTDAMGEVIKGLGIAITFRMYDKVTHSNIFTFTLINTNTSKAAFPKVAECWFQVHFSVRSDKGFCALPDTFCPEIRDEDYRLNELLYRDVKTYGIGHGCAAMWDDSTGVAPTLVSAESLPEYDVKPIVPGTASSMLSMEMYANDRKESINDLAALCDEYEKWICEKASEVKNLDDKFRLTAEKQIELAQKCLLRMKNGIALLKNNDQVWTAFSFANRAMLMQQLHYKLPLTNYSDFDNRSFELITESDIVMPQIEDKSTWYNPNGTNVYGKWRPFQIAFILMNLSSMSDEACEERSIVDLIWFPTGGGKTEAYLGLTAFTILHRRLLNKDDGGTAVIMRYTLRLLTAQQYERAASLICALDDIREKNADLFGTKRITIGLWVGDSLTDNDSSEVIKRIGEVRKGKSNENVSIMLKCPWCGASMETYKTGKTNQTPGYTISSDKKHVLFCCANKHCDFHDERRPLPLVLFDDEIYRNPPTLLFGTVDKFAMLPFRPQAKSLFGGDNKNLPPDLIIQDELHLITGPLGSTVGLYETLINRLCCSEGHYPKVIASTATISHAKQQCNALYDCGEDNVFQFPVQGISYRDCFFAKEDSKAVGRKYVGLYGAAASSSATASIFTFAAFLYGIADLSVSSEEERDPYWTNLSYFGSMRELGQAATWYIADIKERLEVLYQSHLKSSDKAHRRYIYESGLAELTSRMSNADIPQILKLLEVKYPGKTTRPLDMCLATNMVSVGVDVPRLGLMTVTGQPKSFSEYIQATSRVGRSANAPGLVFVIYNTSKPRDKSYYEKFQAQHSKLYKSVEPTSVTPFSRPLRERALHAIFVALHRFYVEEAERNNASRYPSDEEFNSICETILERASHIDPEAVDDIKEQLLKCLKEWRGWTPSKYEDLNPYHQSEEAPLMYGAGTIPAAEWGSRGWKTQMSMRNVDRECQLDCSRVLSVNEEE